MRVDIADALAVQAVFANEVQYFCVSDKLGLRLDLQESQNGRPVFLEAAQRKLPNDKRVNEGLDILQ